MSDTMMDARYGELENGDTLRLERLLPGPIERVWAYLTQSELRAKWLAAGEMPLSDGAPFQLTWNNNQLTDPPGAPPEGMGDCHTMDSRITELDAPHRLSFAWSNTGDVTFELKEVGDEVLLTVIHRQLPATGNMRKYVSAGWHAHTDILAAELRGERPARPFWDNWTALTETYTARLGL